LVTDTADASPEMLRAKAPFRSLPNDILTPVRLPRILGLAHVSPT
jgi:hypothetical protein